MTGIVGKIVKEFERCVFPSQSEGHSFVDMWLKVENIRCCVYQGSASFEGKHAKKILLKVASLDNFLQDTRSINSRKSKAIFGHCPV